MKFIELFLTHFAQNFSPAELRSHKLYALIYRGKRLQLLPLYAEHPIGALSPRGTSIVYLPAEFEPLTVA